MSAGRFTDHNPTHKKREIGGINTVIAMGAGTCATHLMRVYREQRDREDILVVLRQANDFFRYLLRGIGARLGDVTHVLSGKNTDGMEVSVYSLLPSPVEDVSVFFTLRKKRSGENTHWSVSYVGIAITECDAKISISFGDDMFTPHIDQFTIGADNFTEICN